MANITPALIAQFRKRRQEQENAKLGDPKLPADILDQQNKSKDDNLEIIKKVRGMIAEDPLNVRTMRINEDPELGQSAQIKSPETGTTSNFYSSGMLDSSQDLKNETPEIADITPETPSDKLKTVLAARKPSFEDKAKLLLKLRQMGVALPKELEDQALTNSLNNN